MPLWAAVELIVVVVGKETLVETVVVVVLVLEALADEALMSLLVYENDYNPVCIPFKKFTCFLSIYQTKYNNAYNHKKLHFYKLFNELKF